MPRDLYAELQSNQQNPASSSQTPAKPRDLYAELKSKSQPTQTENSEPSSIGNFARGVGQGGRQLFQGIKQAGLEAGEAVGIADKDTVQNYTKDVKQQRQDFEESPAGQSFAGSAGKFVGEVGPTLLVPGGVVGGIAKRIGTSALAGGAIGATQFKHEDDSRLSNAVKGAAFSGATTGALATAGKALKGVRGSSPEVMERSTKMNKLSKEYDIPVTVGEQRGSVVAGRTETQLERVPVLGIGKFREGQANKARAAAERQLAKFDNDEFEDFGKEIQSSLGRVLKTRKDEASKKYDALDRLVKDSGDTPFKTNIAAVADEQLTKLNELDPLGSDTQVISLLQKIKSQYSAADNLRPETNRFKRANSSAQAGGTDELRWSELRALRSSMLKKSRQVEKLSISGSVSDDAKAAISRMVTAIDDELMQAAELKGGNIAKSAREANAFYKENVVPFKAETFRKALSKDFNTDDIIAQFIKRDTALRDRGNKAQDLVSKLDDRGQQALKTKLLREAIDTATEAGEETFSPQKYASYLNKLEGANEKIFTKREFQELKGLSDLMIVIRRAGQFRENPPTGIRQMDAATIFGGGAVIGGGVGETATIASGVGSVLGLSKLLTTRAGRAILAKTHSTSKSGKAWDATTDRAMKEFAKIIARDAAYSSTEADIKPTVIEVSKPLSERRQ
ncbi:MAG: hypothetical protein V4629_02975 [Pseudomonadota bacterium]